MKLRNKYYILRHGEALSNTKKINSSWPETFRNPLTSDGIKQVQKSLKKLKEKKLDLIFSSDLLRTKQTADLASKLLKVKPKFDKRLREIDFGSLNGTPRQLSLEELFVSNDKIRYAKKRENYEDLLRRMVAFLKDVDKKYKGKTILIVSHQAGLWVLENKLDGLTLKEGLKTTPKHKRINRGELRELN